MPLSGSGTDSYFYPTVQKANNDVITSAKMSGSSSPYGGAGPVANLTASRTLTQADNGFTFTNIGAGGSILCPVQLSLSIGTTFTFYQTDAQVFGMSLSSSEVVRISTSGTGSTVSCIPNGGTVGSTFEAKKLTDTLWGLMCYVQNVG